MTDQSAYVNAYLENTVAMLHDQLNQIIQLKTQIKLSENLLSQKDSTIADLSNKLASSTVTEKEFAALKEKARIAEDSHHALVNKVSHMEALQNQFNELKRMYVEKEKELDETKSALEEYRTKKEPEIPSDTPAPKRKINTKKKESVITESTEDQPKKESDDF
jgi:predicted  nucleic acid-binding Zn-ribbon protein